MNVLEHLVPDRQVYSGTFPYSVIQNTNKDFWTEIRIAGQSENKADL